MKSQKDSNELDKYVLLKFVQIIVFVSFLYMVAMSIGGLWAIFRFGIDHVSGLEGWLLALVSSIPLFFLGRYVDKKCKIAKEKISHHR